MKNNASIIYFLTRALFLGFGISLLFYQSSKDCYIGALLGIAIGLVITYFFNYIISHKEKRSLRDLYQKNKILGFIAQALIFIISWLILLYTMVLYTVFVISFLLVSSPVYYVIIPYVIIALYLAFKDLKAIARLAAILLPISFIIFLISILGLINFFEPTNFFPILTTTPLNFLKTALIFAGISTFPNILTLHFDQNTKGNLKMYLISALSIMFTCICINGILGAKLTHIFRFPEYMILKQLQVFKFIEKVENIFSAIWIIDLFITTSLAIYSIKETVYKKYDKLITLIITIITVIILKNIFVINYTNELKLYYILPYLSLICGLIVLIVFTLLLKSHSKK